MKKVVWGRAVVLLTLGMVAGVMQKTRAAVSTASPSLSAIPVTLSWYPVADPTVSGFAIYYGPANLPATNRVDAGSNTSATIYGLQANVAYHFHAVSYNAVGLESLPSNELLLTPLAIARAQLARQTGGSMRLSSKAEPGTVCSILFTPTLAPATWRALANVTADSVGNVIVTDATASKAKSRFYRVVIGEEPLVSELTVQPQPNGSVLLTGYVPPGDNCAVLYASIINPTSWQTLTTVAADADGKVTVLDTTAGLAGMRFYKLVMQ
jgi:hypothetical protein